MEIIHEPDPRLRLVCEPVAEVDQEVRGLMDDMLETMYAAQGIGLAAIQVGVLKRVIVVDVGEGPVCMANPEVRYSSKARKIYKEGCLSVPDVYDEVERPSQIVVRYLNRDNAYKVLKADGLLAVCLQHEIDHLNGVLFTDRIGDRNA